MYGATPATYRESLRLQLQEVVKTASNSFQVVCAYRGKGDVSGSTTDMEKSHHLVKAARAASGLLLLHLKRLHRLSSGDP
jgi:hypothetical protein